MTERYYFSTSDLVIIALLSSLGGVMSAYVSYLGKIINNLLGVPFGAGQMVAGLHVFWLVLILIIVRKTGSATLAGAIKGFVELFSGSPHGIIIVLISAIQGLTLDVLLALDRVRNFKPSVALAAGASSATNVILLQLIYFSSKGEFVVPIEIIFAIIILSFCSGIVLGGLLALETFDILQESNLIPKLFDDIPSEADPHAEKIESAQSSTIWRKRIRISSIITAVFLLLLIVGAVGYFAYVYESPLRDRYSCKVTGEVEYPYTYHPEDFEEFKITIEAELVGSVTYVPLRNYTGIPIHVILAEAQPKSKATQLRVSASDGYFADFDLPSAMTDDELILMEDDGLRLIAGNYDGWFWIRSVVKLEVL
ncbi:MAG: ECF transporter S component [Candidatus Thorarchaeota archaeon]